MKRYVLIAGVNGAGKSTFYYAQQSKFDHMARVNMDEILRALGDWKDVKTNIEAGKEAVRQIREYFDEGKSFNQETTLCGHSILKNIETAKKLGYQVELYYIGVESADIAKERVRLRVEKGGHGIPDQQIEKRYLESLHNCREVLKGCDLAALYDNTEELHRFAIYHKGRLAVLSHTVPGWYVRYIAG